MMVSSRLAEDIRHTSIKIRSYKETEDKLRKQLIDIENSQSQGLPRFTALDKLRTEIQLDIARELTKKYVGKAATLCVMYDLDPRMFT